MSELALQLDGERTAYEPGDVVEGTATWALEEVPRGLEVRLYWKTTGKGTTDVTLVDRVPLASGAAQGRQPFRLRLPGLPYSFSGRLVSLVWGIELFVEPGRKACHRELVMAPAGRAVILHDADGAAGS